MIGIRATFTSGPAAMLQRVAPGRGGGNLLPGLRALRTVELLGDHRHLAALDLDLDLVGMGRNVVVPRRVPGRPVRRSDDQPAAVLTGKPADRIGPLGPGLPADCGQDQAVEAHDLAALAADPAGHQLVHGSERKSGRLAGAARSGFCIEAHDTLLSRGCRLVVDAVRPGRRPARPEPGTCRGSAPPRRGPSPAPRTTRPGRRA